MASILIVEDEIAINELVKRNLQLVGHQCTSVFDGETAISEIQRRSYDLIILDIMLPQLNGFEAFNRVYEIPTIFLTARNSLSDRITGFSMGADDYLTKPFEMLELLARVEAVLRRARKHKSFFEAGDVRIDFDSRQVFYMNRPVECTPKEYELLEVLVNNRNIALSRERFLIGFSRYDKALLSISYRASYKPWLEYIEASEEKFVKEMEEKRKELEKSGAPANNNGGVLLFTESK